MLKVLVIHGLAFGRFFCKSLPLDDLHKKNKNLKKLIIVFIYSGLKKKKNMPYIVVVARLIKLLKNSC